MILKIHCKYNLDGQYCKCDQIKRKWYEFFGKGCIEYSQNPINCKYKESYNKNNNLNKK